jgi:hypothetical protein
VMRVSRYIAMIATMVTMEVVMKARPAALFVEKNTIPITMGMRAITIPMIAVEKFMCSILCLSR